MEGAGRAIVPTLVCSGTQAQEDRTGMGTKGHMAKGSQRVRQEPSGEPGWPRPGTLSAWVLS